VFDLLCGRNINYKPLDRRSDAIFGPAREDVNGQFLV
jgi:hypothetical protein